MAKKNEAPAPEDLDGVGDGEQGDDAALVNKFVEEHVTVTQQSIEAEIKNQEKVQVFIHNQDGPGGDKPVFVGANGIGYLIPREKWVSVPMIVVNGLNDATETRYYREDRDGQATGPMLSKEVRRYSFSTR